MAFDIEEIKLGISDGMANIKVVAQVIVAVLLIIALVTSVFIFRQLQINESYRVAYVSLTDDLRLLSQQIPTLAANAAAGNMPSFGALDDKADEFALKLKVLWEGDSADGLPPSPDTIKEQLGAVETDWNKIGENIRLLIDSGDSVVRIQQEAEGLRLASLELQAMMDEVLGLMIEAGEPPQQIYFASLQLTYAERMTGRLQEALLGTLGSSTAANEFARWTKAFRDTLDSMRGESSDENMAAVKNEAALALLGEVDSVFSEHEQNVEEIMGGIPRFFEAREAVSYIIEDSAALLSGLDRLEGTYGSLTTGLYTTVNATIAAVLAAVLLVLLGIMALFDARARAREAIQREADAEDVTQSQNMAVLQLLDDIEPLQDGDLTVEASVDAAFTGTIADAINSSIDTLRSLVSAINDASAQVSSAAQSTVSTTRELAKASEQQARDIGSANQLVTDMAESMEGVSQDADKSAEVARNSVEIAHKGGETVRSTIAGMDKIREQIQETSKRLKRLGESSQEIGDIVGLINDIADQTNILALNAAIQASSAGEAGRGFAVVADEVQRLAERSTSATKQIENLVSAIQVDTNEAIISMEQTTAEVVEGGKRAENAGEALDEIETVSNELADLINRISHIASQHAEGAARISKSMDAIESVTRQASSGATQTADSINDLAKMAEDLKQQVSGFRLST